MPTSAARFAEVFARVERLIEERWAIPVRIRDVPHPFTGDLDGAEIHVDYDLEAEDALFIVVHLFGHTVQWNVDDDARAIGMYTGPWDDATLARLRGYEVDACRYSMQLFHDAGVTDLDQWLSDFAACDYAYLEHFYRTGEKRPFRSFWRDGNPCLSPLAIPAFSPRRWMARGDGIVV
ncbi:MAG: hypothetical protein HS111_01595 [Kofleriaceae bacterium]|nr:hypothetical protein [Kofleriaceae bacterium]MCL4226942.1 hypothetical protein [Myxococcales bacterium]